MIMMMMLISAVPVREEAAAQTPTVAEISPVRTALVVHPLYQVSVPMVKVIVGTLSSWVCGGR